MENVRTRMIGDKLGFFSKYSYLSNFYPTQLDVNSQRFDSAEQAYQYTKSIICQREEACKSIKECPDPKKVKRFGDKIPTTPQWEEVKEKTMRCILLAKFLQNKDLRRKLSETGTVELMECTTNPFWGTGWRLDSYEWQKSMKYPGKNRLGKMLEEIRDEVRMTPLPANLSYTQMEQEVISVRHQQEQTPSTDAKIQRAEGAGEEAIVGPSMEKRETIGNQSDPTPGTEAGKQCNPTTSSSTNIAGAAREVIDMEIGTGAGAVGGEGNDRERISSVSSSNADLLQIDEADVTSLSCDSDLLRSSFSAKSVILEDGYIDCEKMMTWALPTVNISRLRHIAAKDKGSTFSEQSSNLPRATSNIRGNSTIPTTTRRPPHPTHSTPMSHVTKRKTRKSFKVDEQTQKLKEKYKILKMLSSIQKPE